MSELFGIELLIFTLDFDIQCEHFYLTISIVGSSSSSGSSNVGRSESTTSWEFHTPQAKQPQRLDYVLHLLFRVKLTSWTPDITLKVNVFIFCYSLSF